jgi:phospholipid/cholesterol/gamma-HCH transport system substrate-binding protein
VVGAFVLLLGTILIVGVLWLASGGSLQKKYVLYLAILDESVAGLNINAPVKYHGVDVGKVKSIDLDTNNPELVRLIFAIERDIPIKVDTVAVLKTQGLTGIAYIELDGGAKNAAPLEVSENEEYPIIQTKPSLSTRLETVLTTVLAKLDNTSSNVDALLSVENREAFKNTLANMQTVTKAIAARSTEIDAGIVNASRAASNTAQATQKLNPMLDKLEPVINQLSVTIDQINRSATAIERAGNEAATATASASKTVESVGTNIEQYTAETLPEVQRLLLELNELSASLTRLSEQTERDPASLLRGRSPVPDGPGESSSEKASK